MMEHIRLKGVTADDYTEQFKVKRNNIQRMEGKPPYAMVKLVLNAVKMNLINMDDQQDAVWGKLHIIQNTSLLANGPAHR